ncbi:hypothetical protein Tco_0397001, partial [Tanacetum coccineum]
EDSFKMGNEDLNCIPNKELNKEILIPIPRESKIGKDCDFPSCDDFQSFKTFSNPLFEKQDDFPSRNDESILKEEVHEEAFKSYLNPLFEKDEEIISNEASSIISPKVDVKTIMSFFAPIGNCVRKWATSEFEKDNVEVNHEVFKNDSENSLGIHDDKEEEIAFLDGLLEDENFFEMNDKKVESFESKTKEVFETKVEPEKKKELQVFHPDIEILDHLETTSYVGSDYVFYEDFNLVDMIFPMNIQGKIFDPGITFHGKSFEKDGSKELAPSKALLTLDVFDPLHPPLMDFHVTKAFFGFTFSILKIFSKKFYEPGIKNVLVYLSSLVWGGKDWKDKKKQKRSKTDKKRGKDKESRTRVRNQPEITAGSARHMAPVDRLIDCVKVNLRLSSDVTSKEATLQVVYDVLKLTPFYKAFQVTADAPEIYMQEFWATAYVHNRSVRFKMNNKKHILGLDQFRDILQICPKVGNKKFEEPPLEKEILAFLASLGHSGDIRKITDVNVNKLHQPWRSFAAIINKCLSGKPSYDSLRLSQAQILWGMYNKKNVDYAYLLWEDFIFQIENKNTKKGNAMYYPRFTKLVVNFVMDKDPSIPRRNKVNWHYARDDPMFTTINVISRNEDTQLYGAILPTELTNKDIRNSESYKEYYAIASGMIPPKTKGSKKKADTDTITKQKPPTVPKEVKEKKSGKGKQKSTELETISEAVLTEAEQLKIITKRSRKETHSSHASGSGADEGTGVTPGVLDAF